MSFEEDLVFQAVLLGHFMQGAVVEYVGSCHGSRKESEGYEGGMGLVGLISARPGNTGRKASTLFQNCRTPQTRCFECIVLMYIHVHHMKVPKVQDENDFVH